MTTKPSHAQHPLAAAGVHDDADTLLILPKSYIDMREAVRDIRQVPRNSEDVHLFEAVIESLEALDRTGQPTKAMRPYRIKLLFRTRAEQTISASIFGATFAWSRCQAGDQVQFLAKLSSDLGGLCFKSVELAAATGRVQVVYPGISGKIASSIIGPYVHEQVERRESVVCAARRIRDDPVVSAVLKAQGYQSATQFVTDLHTPSSLEDGKKALRAARRACVEHIQAAGRAHRTNAAAGFNIDSYLIELVKAQPIRLSDGQRKALNVIRQVVNQTQGAKVLLNGDVGAGKSWVFLLAAAAVARSGRLAAIMVPSELVANQIAALAKARFPELNPTLFAGSTKRVVPDDCRLLIGTQALISLDIKQPLGMLVVDEQHKLSVGQRNAMVTPTTHVIEASATPIPRSLALALFDGWVEARIDGFPVEKTIISKILTPDNDEQAKQSIRNSRAAGKKTIMVYPSVKSGEKSAQEAFARLDAAFPGLIALVHGRLKPVDKEKALDSFRSGQCPVLVATTVIEVGVDVPGIATFIVHEAQTFGVSQLHQMRGRLVRDGGYGEFFMMTKAVKMSAADGADSGGGGGGTATVNKDTMKRLEAVRDNLNGFALAERDMELRGFGDVLGDAQSGGTDTFFKLAKLEAKDFLPRT